MCRFCELYGDPKHSNGLWYLNPNNYARNMYKLRMPGEKYMGVEASPETGVRQGPTIRDLVETLDLGDEQHYNQLISGMKERRRKEGSGGQVVPPKGALKVLEFCSPIGLIACLCRKWMRGVDERGEHEFTCMGMGVGMLKWERWPERYKGGVKFVSVEEAQEWTRMMDKKGYVHCLMLFGAPYIGGFCQCDYPDCTLIRDGVDFGIGVMKSHYVAMVDYETCNGCGICVQRCQWGAIKFELSKDRTNIDQFRCYGCGVCETGCPRGAIKLLERKNMPALAEVW